MRLYVLKVDPSDKVSIEAGLYKTCFEAIGKRKLNLAMSYFAVCNLFIFCLYNSIVV